MLACKSVGRRKIPFGGKALWMKAVNLCLVFGLSAGLFALDFPTVESPSMPSISGSSSGPSTPWRGSAPYVPSQQNLQQTDSSESDSTDQELSDTVAGLALTAQSISGLGGLKALESLSGLGDLTGLSGISSLTGLDTKSLEAALEKLQDSNKTSQTTEATGSTTTTSSENLSSENLSSETVATLQQILQKLELLAEAQAASQKESESTSSTPNTSTANTVASGTTNLSPSRILRFRANSTDLLPSCKTVYFSQPDPAGIFLLTGDRVVKAGGKDRNETFYFLFTPTLDAEGKFVYQVEAELTQDWAADRSELYPLTTALPLTATRTGNLITLRHNSEGWNLDLLLDLREAE